MQSDIRRSAIPLPLLPEELIGEILLRLPVRPLLKFKCVCKSWKTLISCSQFIKSHLQISTIIKQQLVFSLMDQPRDTVSYPLKPLFENPSTPIKPAAFSYTEDNFNYIIGSCNGLLCVMNGFSHCVRLCNPSLRFISKKPPKPVLQYWFLANYGFGYDQVNDKYKVLLVVRNYYHHRRVMTKIYTFGQDDSWKIIPNSPYALYMFSGKFVSGTLNWICLHQNTFVSFDMEKETFMELLLPQNDDADNVCDYRMLCVLSNCLCISDYFASENSHWVVWMMKDYGVVESWTKFMIIPHDNFNFIKNQPCFMEPLFISENGILMVRVDSQVILYNSNTSCWDPLMTMKFGLDPHIYCESLVSPQL